MRNFDLNPEFIEASYLADQNNRIDLEVLAVSSEQGSISASGGSNSTGSTGSGSTGGGSLSGGGIVFEQFSDGGLRRKEGPEDFGDEPVNSYNPYTF